MDLFEIWDQSKKETHSKTNRLYFKEGDVFWSHIGKNIGDEEYGKGEMFLRPVVIIKRFNAHLFLCVPLSSIIKYGPYYHLVMLLKEERSSIENIALLSQLRVLDAKSLHNKIGKISIKDGKEIKRLIIENVIQ